MVKQPLAKRLRQYWQLEAVNIVLLPVAAVLMVVTAGGAPDLVLAFACLVNGVLLAIGACYWRIVLYRVEGDGRPFARWLPRLAAAEPFAAVLTLLAVLVTGYEVLMGQGGWTASRIAATAITTLAVLEYVNYYRLQLQYFDHAPDFMALLKRRTLKQAHLARDIAEWRANRSVKDI